ncbi:MAG: transposase [Coriobacteriaceae bacterium]
MKRVAGTLRKEREGILNWWERSLTNSFLEGLNSPAQSVRNTARGFRNIACFKAMVFLKLGNSTSRPRGSWPVLPTRDVEELKNKSRTHRFGSSD